MIRNAMTAVILATALMGVGAGSASAAPKSASIDGSSWTKKSISLDGSSWTVNPDSLIRDRR